MFDSENYVFLMVQVSNTVIFKEYTFGQSDDQNIFLMYIYLYPQVLAHRLQNPWNFISVESDKAIFYVNEVTVEPTMRLEGWKF